jgi:hypothetical protein
LQLPGLTAHQRLDRPGRQAGLSSFLASALRQKSRLHSATNRRNSPRRRGEAAVIWRVGEGRKELGAVDGRMALEGIAKGLPLAALAGRGAGPAQGGRAGVAHATRNCALVTNEPFGGSVARSTGGKRRACRCDPD